MQTTSFVIPTEELVGRVLLRLRPVSRTAHLVMDQDRLIDLAFTTYFCQSSTYYDLVTYIGTFAVGVELAEEIAQEIFHAITSFMQRSRMFWLPSMKCQFSLISGAVIVNASIVYEEPLEETPVIQLDETDAFVPERLRRHA